MIIKFVLVTYLGKGVKTDGSKSLFKNRKNRTMFTKAYCLKIIAKVKMHRYKMKGQ